MDMTKGQMGQFGMRHSVKSSLGTERLSLESSDLIGSTDIRWFVVGPPEETILTGTMS